MGFGLGIEQSLITLPVNGKAADLVVTGGKTAIFDAMDRTTGQYLFSRDLGLQNVVKSIDPVTGKENTSPILSRRPASRRCCAPIPTARATGRPPHSIQPATSSTCR